MKPELLIHVKLNAGIGNYLQSYVNWHFPKPSHSFGFFF